MYGLLISLHVFICIALVVSVLLQSAKGEGLAGAFGGTSLTGTVFGGRGAATFLSRATAVLAVGFMASCIVLALIRPPTGTRSATGGESAVQQAARTAPTPEAPPVQQPGSEGNTQQTQSSQQTQQAKPAGQPPSPGDELFQTTTKPDSGKK